MPRYLIERTFAEEVGLTKNGVEGINRINDDEGVVCLSVEGEKARAKPCVPLQSIDNASLIELAILRTGRDSIFETSLSTVRVLLG